MTRMLGYPYSYSTSTVYAHALNAGSSLSSEIETTVTPRDLDELSLYTEAPSSSYTSYNRSSDFLLPGVETPTPTPEPEIEIEDSICEFKRMSLAKKVAMNTGYILLGTSLGTISLGISWRADYHRRLNQCALLYLKVGGCVVSNLFATSLKHFNSQAEFFEVNIVEVENSQTKRSISIPFSILNPENLDGIVAAKIGKIYKKIIDYIDTCPKIVRHVSTKLTEPMIFIALVIARLTDFVIGLREIGNVWREKGKKEASNTLAYRQLQILQILPDFYQCLLRFIHADAFRPTFLDPYAENQDGDCKTRYPLWTKG